MKDGLHILKILKINESSYFPSLLELTIFSMVRPPT